MATEDNNEWKELMEQSFPGDELEQAEFTRLFRKVMANSVKLCPLSTMNRCPARCCKDKTFLPADAELRGVDLSQRG